MSNKNPEQPESQAEFVRSVFAEYGADLHRFLTHRLRRDQDAKDLAQEVYLRLLRFGKSELVRDPHAYVFHIACQVVGQHRLRARRDLVTFDSEVAHEQSEHPGGAPRDVLMEQLSAQRQLARLLTGLSTLSPTHRKVVLMRRWDGASRAQIAERLNLSVHTVKKYIAEANARLGIALWANEEE